MELESLSERLGGPAILMKRDDMTGDLAFGGNKMRMLEFRLAPAVRQGADVIVSGFGIQSNHARQVAVAARKLGMDVSLILRRTPYGDASSVQGNLLLDLLVGASVRIVNATAAEQASLVAEEMERLRREGRRPYQTGYHDEDLSAVAYVACALELHEQLAAKSVDEAIVYLSSEGATQAGLQLFSKHTEAPYRIVGVNPVDWIPDVPERIAAIGNAAAERLGLDSRLTPGDIVNHAEAYRGSAYGVPTEEGIAAIRLVAETEGILLEPAYTGKAMAGLLDHIRSGRLSKADVVVFLHTGGIPALFCYAEEFDFGDRLLMS
jgi:1-aminocyclopropane-1-carboxylate deaminase/D-cysteine desulfhydrase-like pyridoxal-dependent ACC family enzyme